MASPANLENPESPAELVQFLRDMLFIRRFESKCNFAYRQGKIGGYMHVYIGMEATAVGWIDQIRVGWDTVITAYRDHAHPLLMGSDPVRVMAEIMGRKCGLSHGKGGSMHLYDIEKGFFGGWGIVGGHTPLGAGLAFAAKYRSEDRVTLCFLGDGAANAGVFYETLNMAALWELPVIFIIENNEFAMGTRLEYHAADTELYKRGYPFNMRHERLDGMCVRQMRRDAHRIVEFVRTESKPYLVEVMNYRYAGHGAADNDRQLYRSKEEEDEATKRDPIVRLETQLVEMGAITREEIEAIDQEMVDKVEAIYSEADACPFPDPEDLYANVYSDMEPERGH